MTDAVNKSPYAVLLLDEIEKAHPDLFNILLQVMDHAALTDNNGKKADFRNIILIMTTNAGAREMSGAPLGFGQRSNAGKGKEAIEKMFSPEFRNRLDSSKRLWIIGSVVGIPKLRCLFVTAKFFGNRIGPFFAHCYRCSPLMCPFSSNRICGCPKSTSSISSGIRWCFAAILSTKAFFQITS